MTEPRFDVEDKIAKLLAKAEKTTPEEAKTLTEAAERMMLKYGIEQAVINAKRAGRSHTADEKIIRTIITFNGVYAKAIFIAMADIADAFETVKTVHGHPTKGAEHLWLVGYESDVQQLNVLVTSLQLQLMSALSTWWRDYSSTGMTAMEKFKARRQFILSFGEGAAWRISVARRSAIDESSVGEPGTDLVLRDRRAHVSDWATKQYNLVPGKAVRMAGGGYDVRVAGRTAGRNANTGEGALKATKAIKN